MQSLTDLLSMMGNQSGRPVIDKTGLTGEYDYGLVFADDKAAGIDVASDSAPAFLSAIVQQLGLRLEPKRGVVDILHVDHFNRVPADN